MLYINCRIAVKNHFIIYLLNCLNMSRLYCRRKPLATDIVKKVTFGDSVSVIYFDQTPIETNVCWQQVARDRMRFKRYALHVERRIGYVFDNDHRERVYKLINSV